MITAFQSTLPLRGATSCLPLHFYDLRISIHAPLTGSDKKGLEANWATLYFNPRSPYGERQMDKRRLRDLELFQSTLPLRGATWDVPRYILSEDISIHAPLTGSDSHAFRLTSSSRNFNPRSPYGERLQGHENLPQIAEFQSTLPLRGATRIPGFCVQPRNISIHAPLTGSDSRGGASGRSGGYFNPRSPYGERLSIFSRRVLLMVFQSTLPLRGATVPSSRIIASH